MKRWFWKRWVWTGVFGVTAAVGLAVGAGGGKDAPPAPHKVGEVFTLKFQNGPEKTVKVLKSEKQPDGSYLQELKDTKTGEVFSIIDKSHLGPEDAKKSTTAAKAATTTKAATNKSADAAKGKSQSASAAMPGPIKDAKVSSANKSAAPVTVSKPTVAAPTPLPPEPPEEKPGLLKRLFGKKPTPPTSPAMPVTTPGTTPPSSGMPSTAAKPSFSGMPTTSAKPAARPAIAPPASAFEPGANPYSNPTTTARPAPGTATVGSPKLFPEKSNSTTEPPRVPSTTTTTTTTTPKPPSPSLTPPATPTPQPVATKPALTPQLAPKPPAKPLTSPPSAADSELSRTIPANPSATPRPTEPPRTLPMNPVQPPSVAFPEPVPVPTKPPVVTQPPLPIPTPAPSAPSSALPGIPSTPAPLPIPSVPVTPAPVIPAVPTTPSGLPTIPVPPGGMSAGRSSVMQAGYTSVAAMALVQDIQPHVVTLRTAVAPSMRVLAARALSGGRHASSDTVKSVLFIACTSDPSPFVRASCIDELCKLGYFDPAFLAHLHKATGDSADEVRTAAKEALEKMVPSRK